MNISVLFTILVFVILNFVSNIYSCNVFDQINFTPLKKKNDSVKVKITMKDIRKVVSRIPNSIYLSLKSSTISFVTSCGVLIPVGLVMNINKPKPIDAWLLRGVSSGMEWAKISAFYTGGETFFLNVRGKDDRMNAYLGSAVASALLRIEEGPLGMIQGFVVGYGFMYAIDQLVVPKEISQHNGISTSKTSSNFNKNIKRNRGPTSNIKGLRR